MSKEQDYDIDINSLMNNGTAVQELINHVASLHESLDQAKSETKKERATFHEAIEILDDGFVMYDEEDRLIAFNKAFKDQIGEPAKYLEYGETYESMTLILAKSGIIPGIAGKEEEFVAKLMKQRQSEDGLEKIFQTNEGEWIRQRDKKNATGHLVGLRTNITELKNREEELEKATSELKAALAENKQSKERFKAFAEANTDWFWEMDSELRFCYFSESFESVSGVKPEQLLGKTRNETGIPNVDPEVYQAHLEDLEAHRPFRDFIHPRTKDDGSVIWLAISAIPVFDIDGNFERYLGSGRDISRNKNREQELEAARRESEISLSRQRKIANAIPQGIIMFENDKIVFFNEQAPQILELSDDILFEEQTFEKFLSMQATGGHFGTEEDGLAFIEKHTNVVSIGIPYQLERVTKSGRVIRVDGVPNKKENSLTLTFTDISSLKEREIEMNQAQVEAEEASILLDEAIDAMPQGMLIHDQDVILRANSGLAEMLDIPANLVSPGNSLREFVKYLLERGDEGDIDIEEMLNKSDDMCARAEAFSLERKLPNGKIIISDVQPRKNGGMVSSYTDVTKDRKREKELQDTMKIAESAERAKSEFLANMSHEIRTPMNGVMGMAELLASTELDTKQKMFTDVIVKSGASLLTIINDILDFSKIDAGQMELDPAPFNLAEAIEDVATLVSSKVAEKDLELIVRVDPALPKMMIGDVGRIRQIVTNLLGNAVKFTEKGHVFVNIEGKKGQKSSDIANLTFSVEDTGIGIPEEKCAQVFQKFSQADTSATRKHEGTGLGLSISSSLVELMGGEIGVESEVGKGSTFWFTAELPVYGEAEEKQVVPGDMTGSRILVVDDNKVNRSILAEQMAAWKFDGASTSSGVEGLEVMRAVTANNMSLDLVILDYQMPEMSGAEVLEIMRNDEALKDIPVVMLTSVDSSQTNQRLQRLGAEANLTKPTRSSMLLETILQVIANKRADVKTRSINNLTARSAPDQSNITLSAAQSNKPITSGSQELDILVAEDNEVNQIVFRQILEETGLNFKIVENGRLAFATYKVQKPRLILMDVSMPEMNGKEATTAIRKYERDNEMIPTPIVGVTAHALKGDMESCIDAGMDDYLSKPVSPKKLSLKIEQWLKVNLGKSITG